MVDEREVQKWIARLECEDSSWSNYEKLAVLYAIQNKKAGATQAPSFPEGYSSLASAEPLGAYGNSDFLKTVSGKDPEKVWPVIDELMDTLKIVNIRVYENVMQKLRRV